MKRYKRYDLRPTRCGTPNGNGVLDTPDLEAVSPQLLATSDERFKIVKWWTGKHQRQLLEDAVVRAQRENWLPRKPDPTPKGRRPRKVKRQYKVAAECRSFIRGVAKRAGVSLSTVCDQIIQRLYDELPDPKPVPPWQTLGPDGRPRPKSPEQREREGRAEYGDDWDAPDLVP